MRATESGMLRRLATEVVALSATSHKRKIIECKINFFVNKKLNIGIILN